MEARAGCRKGASMSASDWLVAGLVVAGWAALVWALMGVCQ